MSSIKLIDVSPISLTVPQPELEHFQLVAKQLAEAFQDIGFACLQNHGVSEVIITEAMRASLEYFHLPDDIKGEDTKGKERQGWVKQGREIFDQDEDGNIAEFEAKETYDMKDISASGRFPDQSCPKLRYALCHLARDSKELALRLLTCLSLALGQSEQFLGNKHKGMLIVDEDSPTNATTLRSIHYPPMAGSG